VPGCKLVIAGDGPQRQELEELSQHVAGGRVRFTGYQPPERLRAILRRASLVVVPSEWYENCPYAILEAFAAGKPVIASNIGGIPELVEGGQDGLLFEPGQAGELAACIRSLVGDGRLRQRLGQSARRKVKELYGPESHYTGLIHILVHCTSSDRRTRWSWD
jgi:glycosyltransferase involved in cell wall biosynthesis